MKSKEGVRGRGKEKRHGHEDHLCLAELISGEGGGVEGKKIARLGRKWEKE